MEEVYEWGWIARFTDDGGAYESAKNPMSEADARAYVEERQWREDEERIADGDDDPHGLHLTYSLRRRPKPVEPEWEEVP